MEKITIQSGRSTYPLWIGQKIIHELPLFLHEIKPTKLCIVTDENVHKYHMPKLLKEIEGRFPYSIYIAPSGEHAKTFQQYYELLTFALHEQLDRNSLFIAFGGGAIGDLTGFAAATYMRGIPFIQMPTTILAHDSSVGGKTGINHPKGKNLIGAFHHPLAVFYDLQFLETLPLKERLSGFAEIIKEALISSERFLGELMETMNQVEKLTPEHLFKPLIEGILVKKKFIEKDEKEQNIRAYLNFGHTLGHAIENELGYGKISHGEAVAIGMIFALKLSEKLIGFSYPIRDLINWFENLGYQTNIPAELSEEELLQTMKQDKKALQGQLRFVLLKKIGDPVLYHIDDVTILKALHAMKKN